MTEQESIYVRLHHLVSEMVTGGHATGIVLAYKTEDGTRCVVANARDKDRAHLRGLPFGVAEMVKDFNK